MRLKLHIASVENAALLPYNYQYRLSAWIYNVLSKADMEYAAWLHDNGYAAGSKTYKLFTFSQLMIKKYKAEKGGLRLMEPNAELILSFWADEAMEKFITGIFSDQQFFIGNSTARVNFMVTAVERLPDPVFTSTHTFRCLSPICLSRSRGERMPAEYMAPGQPEYEQYFFNHIIRKYATAMQYAGGMDINEAMADHPFQLEILNEPRKKGMKIKEGTADETQVIPYLYRFKLTAPPELIEFSYHANCGEKNGQGLGCVEEE